MPVRIEANAEPIPGYRLIERLGGGGFGEVWKAEAPGGLFKAIKFVYGDLSSADVQDGVQANQELKALSRVKTVHHPYILSLDRYDIVDGQLMIVMELADRTLWDRFRECRSQGLPGIPRPELLSYLEEVAEALDLMNNQFQLQHLDIKPQNLFLVFNHVKVADFGLVKDLGTRAAATMTGGVTPVYAAPETFDGWLSRFSDQYSLAIVFQELLTGQRPFTGGTMRQLILQHMSGKPDLSPLPAADRPIVDRALAKDPDQRFPTCLEFVQLLRATSAPRPDVQTPEAVDLPPEPVEMHTQGLRGKDFVAPKADAPALGGAELDPPPELPAWMNEPAAADTPAGAASCTPAEVEHHTSPVVRPRASVPVASVPRPGSTGIIQPALVIGLGKFGLHTLRQLRQRLNAEFQSADALTCIRLLGLDTDQEAVHAVTTGEPNHCLGPGEALLTRLHRPSHYLKGSGKAETDTWLSPKLIYRIPRDQNSAGLRPLGRLAFVDNYRSISRRLEAELRACLADPAVEDAGTVSLRSRVPRVYLATCLAGNTGGGMFLDVAYVVRHLLRRLGHGTADVVGLFFVPPAGREGTPAAAQVNTVAALTELRYFSRNYFKARYADGEGGQAATKSMTETAPPFQRCVVLEVPELGRSSSDEPLTKATAEAGDYLYRDLATVLGQAADEDRQASQQGPAPRDGGPAVQSFGSYRLSWPRQTLLEQCGRRLCRKLVEHWMNKDARPVAEAVQQWAAGQWDAIGMRPEDLIARHQELCEKLLRQSPDRMLVEIVAPLAKELAAKPGADTTLNVGPVLQALAQLDKTLGIPDECRPSHQAAEPSLFEQTLAEACVRIADAGEERLAALAVRLIEDPNYRLAGAEESLRQFSVMVEKALRAQEPLSKELDERAVLLYRRVLQMLDSPAPTSGTPSQSLWKMSFGRRGNGGDAPPTASDLLEVLKLYAKTRFQSLLLQHVNRLYVGLRGHLSDQLREVGFCRQRLSELAGILQPSEEERARKPRKPSRRSQMLLPSGCVSLEDVIAKVEKELKRDDLLLFDQRAQALIGKQFQALVQVCMGASSVVRALAPVLVREAQKYLEPRFQGTSVAEMFFAQKAHAEGGQLPAVLKDVEKFYGDAAPTLPCPSGRADEIAVAVIPNDAKGQELLGLLREHLPHVRAVGTDRWDEIAFYRERTQMALADLEQLGPAAQAIYQQRLAADPTAVHSRDDVGDWQPLSVGHPS